MTIYKLPYQEEFGQIDNYKTVNIFMYNLSIIIKSKLSYTPELAKLTEFRMNCSLK